MDAVTTVDTKTTTVVDTTILPPKRKDGHNIDGLTAEESLFERIQSTKLILAVFIFCISAIFCWYGKIDAKSYSDIAAWVIMAYIAGDVGSGVVDAMKGKLSNSFQRDRDRDGDSK